MTEKEKDIWVKSTIPEIIVKHNNPTFYHKFDNRPVKIPVAIYEFIKKSHPVLLEIVDAPKPEPKKEPKKLKSSFKELPKLDEKKIEGD